MKKKSNAVSKDSSVSWRNLQYFFKEAERWRAIGVQNSIAISKILAWRQKEAEKKLKLAEKQKDC